MEQPLQPGIAGSQPGLHVVSMPTRLDVDTHELPVSEAGNATQTSSADTAQVITITPGSRQRVVLYFVEAYTSAGTATLNIDSPNGTVKYQGQTNGIGMVLWYLEPRTPMMFDWGVVVRIEVGTAGGGNTTTINVQYGLQNPPVGL